MKYDRHEDVRMGDLVITSDVDVFSDKIGIVLEPTSGDKIGRRGQSFDCPGRPDLQTATCASTTSRSRGSRETSNR